MKDLLLLWSLLPLAPSSASFHPMTQCSTISVPRTCQCLPSLGFCTKYLQRLIFPFHSSSLLLNLPTSFSWGCLHWRSRPGVLHPGRWTSRQQYHLATCGQCTFLGLTPESESLGRGPSAPGDSLAAYAWKPPGFLLWHWWHCTVFSSTRALICSMSAALLCMSSPPSRLQHPNKYSDTAHCPLVENRCRRLKAVSLRGIPGTPGPYWSCCRHVCCYIAGSKWTADPWQVLRVWRGDVASLHCTSSNPTLYLNFWEVIGLGSGVGTQVSTTWQQASFLRALGAKGLLHARPSRIQGLLPLQYGS